MRRLSGWAVVILVGVILAVTVTSVAASRNTTYRLGETLVFRVVEQPMNCCCCQPGTNVKILGWRITDSCSKVIHSVTYDKPIPASTWQGKWPEVDIAAVSKAETKVETAAPGSVYQAWQKAMSTYEEYWSGVETRVSPGCYVLYVDTSAGTLSRCLRLYDPMNPRPGWEYCPCGQPAVRTGCWQTTLVVRTEKAPRYQPLMWRTGAACPRR